MTRASLKSLELWARGGRQASMGVKGREVLSFVVAASKRTFTLTWSDIAHQSAIDLTEFRMSHSLSTWPQHRVTPPPDDPEHGGLALPFFRQTQEFGKATKAQPLNSGCWRVEEIPVILGLLVGSSQNRNLM
ncbi:hypothetical protein B0H11DRAFT_1924703 [Mycena galericulata]|nr:hypothetical protein B0H11DRAFT_1924703 [Mycena galericulata]